MKKLVSILLAAVLLIGTVGVLAGCGGENLAGTYDITIWVSEISGVKELTEQQVAAFNAANEGIVINASVQGITEAEAATQMVTSVEDGADIFCFAQDQLARLVMAGALNKLGTAASAEVTANNDAGAVAAATVGDALYCYPLTSDNGYFMYYDKSVVAEGHIDSLEDILADCVAAGKNFSMEIEGSAWYNAAFFFATGCESNWTTDLTGSFTAVDDNFNSPEGLIALKGMQKILKSSAYINSSQATDFAAAIPSAVVISGTWGAVAAKEALGDNFGAADLPSFSVDGQSYHLGSYSGNKLLGVKPSTDAKKNSVMQKLALYLTGEECQNQRFTEFGWGPSNLKVQATDAVKSDATLAALGAQSPYATPQGQIHGSWWDIAKTYATVAKTATTDAELTAALEAYQASIDGLMTQPASEKEAFTVIGKFAGTNWDTDIEMAQKPEGTWYSDVIDFAAGDEFQVRQGKSWDVQFGAIGEDGLSTKNNVVITEAGKYYVKLVFDATAKTGVVSLVKNSPITGFTVIGSINGDAWTLDLPMEIQADGSWLTTEAYQMDAGVEFKVRQGEGWDVAYGSGTNNFVVETAGTYKVQFALTADGGTITLVP